MPFVLDFAKSEVSLLVQSSTYVGAVLLAFGLACFGSVSSLSAIDHALFEALALLRSLAKLGILPLLLDFAKLELPILLRSLVQLGLAASIFGLSCLSLAFFPFDFSFVGSFFVSAKLVYCRSACAFVRNRANGFAYSGLGLHLFGPFHAAEGPWPSRLSGSAQWIGVIRFVYACSRRLVTRPNLCNS